MWLETWLWNWSRHGHAISAGALTSDRNAIEQYGENTNLVQEVPARLHLITATVASLRPVVGDTQLTGRFEENLLRLNENLSMKISSTQNG